MYIEWRPNGHAYRAVFKERKCSKYKAWKKRGEPFLTDDYGSSDRCSECGCYGGHQRVRWTEWKRDPRYDAPAPGSLE